MTRILIIGEAVAPTGFSRVIRSVFQPLADDFELHQLATRYDGRAHDYPWTLHRADAGGSPYGFDRIGPLIEQIAPDIVFILYDIVFLVQYMEALRTLAARSAIVLYVPVEAGPISPELARGLDGAARCVLYTEYGRREIVASFSAVRHEVREFRTPRLEVIPHGVDTDRFFPLSDTGAGSVADSAIPQRRLDARRALHLDDDEHLNAFIVLNANRNMPRKRIDLTMQGFAQFAKDKPANVKLYLHMATEDTGWNVLILAKRYGIFDRLIMSQADNARPAFTDDRLNVLYNACDVGITTTTGEGWGMVSFEHAATSAAQVIPRHTSLAELWDGAAEFIDPASMMTWPGNLTLGHVVSPEGVAAALERLYRDPTRRGQLARAAHANATRPEYRWTAIAARWKSLFADVLAESAIDHREDRDGHS